MEELGITFNMGCIKIHTFSAFNLAETVMYWMRRYILLDGVRQLDEVMNSDEWQNGPKRGCVDLHGEMNVIRGILE